MALDQAISELSTTLEQPAGTPQWCALVRLRVVAVREGLAEPDPSGGGHRVRDGWLAARDAMTERTRRMLLDRLARLGPRVLAHPDSDTSYRELRRLCLDLEHYRQRLHDLVYDSVGLELGGSE